MEIYTYAIDPASVAQHRMVAWVAIVATGLITAGIFAAAPRRALWWSMALVVLLVPTLATLPFGGGLEVSLRYVPDVMAPLTLLGLPGALVGAVVGWGVRRWRELRRQGAS